MRFIWLIVAVLCAVLAMLQWRRNEAGELDTAVSTIDRRLKQLMPIIPAGFAAVAMGYFIWG